jgi:hypothetical protein
MQVHGVLSDQTFEKSRGNVYFRESGNDMRIEFGRIGAEAAFEHLFTDAAIHGSFPTGAARAEKQTQQSGEKTKGNGTMHTESGRRRAPTIFE